MKNVRFVINKKRMTPKRKLIRKVYKKYQNCNKTVLVTIPVINKFSKRLITLKSFS